MKANLLLVSLAVLISGSTVLGQTKKPTVQKEIPPRSKPNTEQLKGLGKSNLNSKSRSTGVTVTPKSKTKNAPKKREPVSNIKGNWLKRTYEIELTIKYTVGQDEPKTYTTKLTSAKDSMTSDILLGISELGPITTTVELTVENEREDSVDVGFFLGMRVPYRSNQGSNNPSSRARFVGYTQFLDNGISTGIRIKPGNRVQVFDSKMLSINLGIQTLK